MIGHNFLLIIRNFKRFKSSFLINLLGLSTGLACALLIFMWVRDEMNMDKFHAAGDRLLQLMENQKASESNVNVTDSTPGMLAEKLSSDLPEVEYAVVMTPSYWFDPFQLKYKEQSVVATSVYASKDFFRMFSFELLAGTQNEVLKD